MKVHVYPQASGHGDAYIVADSDGLLAIRDACDAALKRGATSIEPATADGEGYTLIFMNVETRDPKWENVQLPYVLEGLERTGAPPVEILGILRYREIHAKNRSKSIPPEGVKAPDPQ